MLKNKFVIIISVLSISGFAWHRLTSISSDNKASSEPIAEAQIADSEPIQTDETSQIPQMPESSAEVRSVANTEKEINTPTPSKVADVEVNKVNSALPSKVSVAVEQYPAPLVVAQKSEPAEKAVVQVPEEPTTPEVVPVAPTLKSEKPTSQINTWAWIGSNIVAQSVSHSMEPNVDSSFGSAGQPGIYVRAGFEVNNFGIDMCYENSSHAASSSINANVVNGNYQYDTLRAEGTWKVSQDGVKLRAGVQRHMIPFLFPDATSGEIFVRRLLMTNASVGVDAQWALSPVNRLEAKIGYEHPIDFETLDRATLKTTAKASGNISLGLVRSLSQHLRVGIHTEYQIQGFDYVYRDTPAANEIKGSQTLQSQSLVIRIGLEY